MSSLDAADRVVVHGPLMVAFIVVLGLVSLLLAQRVYHLQQALNHAQSLTLSDSLEQLWTQFSQTAWSATPEGQQRYSSLLRVPVDAPTVEILDRSLQEKDGLMRCLQRLLFLLRETGGALKGVAVEQCKTGSVLHCVVRTGPGISIPSLVAQLGSPVDPRLVLHEEDRAL